MPKLKRGEQGLKTATASAQMSEFCQRHGMGSDDFMSNTGWLKHGSWRTKVDWKELSGWKGIGSVGGSGAPARIPQKSQKPPAKKK